MIQPVISSNKILKWNAQLNFTSVMKKFYNKIVVVELKSCPNLLDTIISNYHQRWFFTLFKYKQPWTVHDADFLLPASKKWRFSYFSSNLSSFELLLAETEFRVDVSSWLFSHELQFKSDNFREEKVVVI